MGVLSSIDDGVGVALLAELLPSQYANPDHLAMIAERLGKPLVADFLSELFPQDQSSRSGDLGEILAASYLEEQLRFVIGPSRLRHRDHREWAMRGDDVLGAKFDSNSSVLIAKVEAKSGARIGVKVIAEARKGLQRTNGMPSPHSLMQFAIRLQENAEQDLGDALILLHLSKGLRPNRVTHLMFLFAGNDPSSDVQSELNSYTGPFKQLTRIVRPLAHQDFIHGVYEMAISHAT